jgi:hypothetical protein
MAYNYGKRVRNARNTVNKRYDNYMSKYRQTVNAQKNADIKASNAQYNANAQQAALRNAVQQRELQRQMYRNGITGGATETTMMNQANNYANQQGKIASDKAASANTIRQKANADIAAFKLQNMQNRAAALDSAKDREYNKYQNYLKRRDDLRKERKEDRRYRSETKYNRKIDKYNRYAQTVSGYDNVKAINRQIRKIKKSGKGKWRIAYLRQQRAAIRERNWERAHR